MTTYLAPTDFSPEATAAVAEAARRADLNGAELLLLHVYSLPGLAEQIGHPRSFPNVEDEAQASSKAQLEEQEKALGKPGLRVRCISRRGVAADEICAVAEEEGVDLIVMAMHSGGRWKHILLGSTTDKVVRSAPCSVLVYRSKAG